MEDEIDHLGLVLHVRGFYATRKNYYANWHSTFHQMRIDISGDIDVNPGPDECSVCNKRVARNHRAVNCDNCNMWSSRANTRSIKTFPHFPGGVLDAFGRLYHLPMRQHYDASRLVSVFSL